MTRTRLIAIGAVCLVGAAIVAMKAGRDHHFGAMAEAYRRHAMSQVSASTTAVDAKAWLERNGFEVALFGDNIANLLKRGNDEFYIVNGYRRFAGTSTIYGERWVELVFLFRTTQESSFPGGFVGVEVDDDSPPTKAIMAAFARRAATARASTTSARP